MDLLLVMLHVRIHMQGEKMYFFVLLPYHSIKSNKWEVSVLNKKTYAPLLVIYLHFRLQNPCEFSGYSEIPSKQKKIIDRFLRNLWNSL